MMDDIGVIQYNIMYLIEINKGTTEACHRTLIEPIDGGFRVTA